MDLAATAPGATTGTTPTGTTPAGTTPAGTATGATAAAATAGETCGESRARRHRGSLHRPVFALRNVRGGGCSVPPEILRRLRVQRPGVRSRPLDVAHPLEEERLLLIVLLAGALGALQHISRSFTTYVGARKFVRIWSRGTP
jgi:hypothetical protein